MCIVKQSSAKIGIRICWYVPSQFKVKQIKELRLRVKVCE